MSALWDPQQGLWNTMLVSRVRRLPRLIAEPLGALIVIADSGLLLLRAAAHRARVRPFRAPGRTHVLYVDCGTHRDGSELRLVAHWLDRYDLSMLAFEAAPDHYAAAQRHLAALSVTLRNVALVGPEHSGKSVRLYRAGGDGRGDSLYSTRGVESVEVAAARLSGYIRDWADRGPVLLRMNIEGAEPAVIEDLAQAGLLEWVDGFYGMWDDLAKIDRTKAVTFRLRLRELGIRPFTFNERDLRFLPRRAAIQMDLETSVRRGVSRRSRSNAT